jgi:hypothetical protein
VCTADVARCIRHAPDSEVIVVRSPFCDTLTLLLPIEFFDGVQHQPNTGFLIP